MPTNMEVPTISKKQLKSTLSMKKFKSKEVIKNILSSPYKNNFWPELSTEDQFNVRIILEKNLPRVKEKKINIPWEKIKSIPKAERKKFRMEYFHSLNSEHPKSTESQGLILGINDVTKSLEQNALSCVLISSDVQPRLMVQHIIDQTILKQIPVLVVPNLRKLTNTFCGISSVTLGIEKKSEETSGLLVIENCVQKLFESISPATEHIDFIRSQLITTQVALENKNDIEEMNCNQDILNDENLLNSVYLKVNGSNGRVFIPKSRKKLTSDESFTNNDSDFIELSGKPNKKRTTVYKSLKVKRLKNDPSRTKKKIKSLKKSS